MAIWVFSKIQQVYHLQKVEVLDKT